MDRESFLRIVHARTPAPPQWVADIAHVAVDHLKNAAAAKDEVTHARWNGEVNGLLAGLVAWAAYEVGEEGADRFGTELLAEAKRLHDESREP